MASVTQVVSSIRWFEEIGIEDIPLVGGKNASLGEMYRELASQGVKVPNGFAITADAYREFLRATKLDQKIREILQSLNTQDLANLRQRGSARAGSDSGSDSPGAPPTGDHRSL